jgi:uncharacterized protein involved in type VI secretion and phage assembly
VSHSLFQTIQRIVQEELGRMRTAELAVVQEQHPHAGDSDKDNYACTVALRNSGIVLKRVPVATARLGSVSVPPVGALVLVQFIGGDVNAPVIVGSLYSDEDRPPVNDDGQAVLHLPLAAADDDAIHVELHSGDERQLAVKFGKGLELTVKDDDPVIELDVASGKATVKIERDGAITIESKGKMQVKASEIALTGESKVELKGPQISVQADGQLTLKGGTVNIN